MCLTQRVGFRMRFIGIDWFPKGYKYLIVTLGEIWKACVCCCAFYACHSRPYFLCNNCISRFGTIHKR